MRNPKLGQQWDVWTFIVFPQCLSYWGYQTVNMKLPAPTCTILWHLHGPWYYFADLRRPWMDACEKKCRKFNASQIPCRLYTVLIILHAHQELDHFTNSLMQRRSIPQLTSSSLGYTESLSEASPSHALYLHAFTCLIAAPHLIFRHNKLLIIEGKTSFWIALKEVRMPLTVIHHSWF